MVDEQPIDLNAIRKELEQDQQDAAELRKRMIATLEYCLDKINTGAWVPHMMYVAAASEGDDGKSRMLFSSCNMNSFEMKGLLTQHLHMQCDPDCDVVVLE